MATHIILRDYVHNLNALSTTKTMLILILYYTYTYTGHGSYRDQSREGCVETDESDDSYISASESDDPYLKWSHRARGNGTRTEMKSDVDDLRQKVGQNCMSTPHV